MGADMTLAEQIPAIDYLEPFQSQYSSSAKMLALANGMAARLDNVDAIKVFYEQIFDPRTAKGKGLDIWARIVGLQGRGVHVENQEIFGFTGQELQNFDHAPFYSTSTGTGVVDLPDDDLKWLIMAKALANISNDSLDGLNAVLRYMLRSMGLGEGIAYVSEVGNMALTVIFTEAISAAQENIFRQFGLFNRGAGMSLDFNFVEG